MSKLIARNVMGRLNMAASLIAPHGDIAGDLMQLSAADGPTEVARVAEARVELCAAYGFESSDTRKPFAFASGIAIIPIHGSLINRFGQSWGFITGYNFIRSQLAHALADDDVVGIVLDCNSYGGEAAGCFETANEVFNARGTKPILAVIDSNCYSACYAIASAADRIVITPTGGAGSIGVAAMHMSMEKMLEDYGIKVTLIYSGDHKVDGNPYENLPEKVRTDIQRGVHATRDVFVTQVARNRGLDESVVRGTEAAIYRANDAVSIGLVDEVVTPQQAVTALLSELSGSPETLENDMPGEEDTNAAAPVATTTMSAEDKQAIITAERERCSAITGSEEGLANPKLANHLAFNTQLSVDEAKATLSAAGAAPAAPAAAAEPAKPAAASADPFKETMDADKHPNVEADGNQPNGEKAKAGTTSSLLSSYQAMTGISLA